MALDPTKYKSADIRQLAEDLIDALTGGSGSTILATGNNHIGQVGGTTVRAQGATQRPNNTTAYAAGDIVSNNNATEVFGALRSPSYTGYITGVKVSTDKAAITPRLRIHFATNPACFNVTADNAAMSMNSPNSDYYIGFMDLSALSSDGMNGQSYVNDFTQRIPIANQFVSGNSSIYYLIETLDAFTPNANQTFTVQPFIEQN